MSNEPTIDQMNEAISEFMGYYHEGMDSDYSQHACSAFVADAKYHTSWSWLMPVVEKIHSLAVAGEAINAITEEAIFTFSIFAPLKDVHSAVFQFITWLNQQKQTNGKETGK